MVFVHILHMTHGLQHALGPVSLLVGPGSPVVFLPFLPHLLFVRMQVSLILVATSRSVSAHQTAVLLSLKHRALLYTTQPPLYALLMLCPRKGLRALVSNPAPVVA